MAAAALPPGSRVVTCKLDTDRAAFARRHIDAAGMADRIELRLGPALETIAALELRTGEPVARQGR